ncbi:MAG: hypothetical protein BRD29_04350 [Bacteroidetes bacterium QH_2_67_10]|nr:MAG: hypothetical protein BRD29_04350 [Bacteroidetes bacterium QH_2_67_10]
MRSTSSGSFSCNHRRPHSFSPRITEKFLPQHHSFDSMRRFLALSCAAVLLIAMAGCDAIGDSGDDSETLTSSVDVQLTSTSPTGASATQAAAALSEDASSEIADIAEASVTISGVELVGEEDAYTLSDEEQTFDLLALADGVPVDLALDEVPAGEYEQLRVAVTDTRLVLSDDTSPNLKVPSNKIKLLLPNFEIEDGSDDTEITIAFDVEDSFVRAGRSGKYIFKPTLRAESVEVGGEELSGNVEVAGEITALDSGTSVEVAGLPFALTERTEIGDDEEENSLAAGQFVELEAGVDGDTYVAQEVKQEEGSQAGRGRRRRPCHDRGSPRRGALRRRRDRAARCVLSGGRRHCLRGLQRAFRSRKRQPRRGGLYLRRKHRHLPSSGNRVRIF